MAIGYVSPVLRWSSQNHKRMFIALEGVFEFEFRTSQNRSRLLSVGSPGESMLLELKEGGVFPTSFPSQIKKNLANLYILRLLHTFCYLSGHLMELHLSSSLNAAKTLQVLSQKRYSIHKKKWLDWMLKNGQNIFFIKTPVQTQRHKMASRSRRDRERRIASCSRQFECVCDCRKRNRRLKKSTADFRSKPGGFYPVCILYLIFNNPVNEVDL